ncbi:LPXTG cell wall anchor domain-containing protein [Streptococcus equi]|uniref:LPXTG cell wall anchor domain-containing protein n=1 Tax=Streptococcus equi subsp. ruminatorum TaxID=254358 RepID=A0A6M1KVU4_9STRE|nr:LPXTG cell wall anchor domain-containing protein [Streptococcus equi]NGL83171.1 LPXTG cell wall anchor domain-containing protein [Streptococcus equi subsp. ruminatorum]
MPKKQLVSVLTATTVALLTTSLAYADETPVPVDPTAPSTEVVTPAPSQPERPVPDKPAAPETPKEELPAPVDPTTPSTGKKDKPATVPGKVESPKEEPKPKDEPKPEAPKTEEDKKTEEVVFKPIVVAPNTTVVGTQNSQVLVRDQAGNVTVLAPEVLGGHVNPNGTVTIKDSTGAEKILPKTGEQQSLLGYLGMMLVSALGYAFKKKLSH